MDEINAVLYFIAKLFNQHKICWGAGGSILLKEYAIIDAPQDIDLCVDIKDIEKASKLLSDYRLNQQEKQSEIFVSDFFQTYYINSVYVDIIGGFKIKNGQELYCYDFDESKIELKKIVKDTTVYYCGLQDWAILYGKMNRLDKKKKIECYLKNQGE